MSRETRGTLHLEDARVIKQTAYDGDQFVLRLEARACAARAAPGTFVHLTCDPTIPMRRPLSIMRADPNTGWIEVLYKVQGPGLHALAARKPGDLVSIIGPIGNPFTLHPERPRPLLIGGGVGIPPMVFLADRLRHEPPGRYIPLVLMGSEIPFPFRTRPSTIVVPGMPPATIACMPLLDEWNIPSRLSTRSGFPGCYDGFVTQLAEEWLSSLAPSQRSQVETLHLRPYPDVGGRRGRGAPPLRPLSGLFGGIHGVRGGRLRRLHGAGADTGGRGHEARLRGRPRIRRVDGAVGSAKLRQPPG